MSKATKWVVGVLIMPLLYNRYSIVFFLLLLLYFQSENLLFASFIYSLLFAFLMGNLGLMKYWLKIFQYLFSVEYAVIGRWNSTITHSHSTWGHPTILVKSKIHEVTVVESGGNIYETEDCLLRKAIFYTLFF